MTEGAGHLTNDPSRFYRRVTSVPSFHFCLPRATSRPTRYSSNPSTRCSGACPQMNHSPSNPPTPAWTRRQGETANRAQNRVLSEITVVPVSSPDEVGVGGTETGPDPDDPGDSETLGIPLEGVSPVRRSRVGVLEKVGSSGVRSRDSESLSRSRTSRLLPRDKTLGSQGLKSRPRTEVSRVVNCRPSLVRLS